MVQRKLKLPVLFRGSLKLSVVWEFPVWYFHYEMISVTVASRPSADNLSSASSAKTTGHQCRAKSFIEIVYKLWTRLIIIFRMDKSTRISNKIVPNSLRWFLHGFKLQSNSIIIWLFEWNWNIHFNIDACSIPMCNYFFNLLLLFGQHTIQAYFKELQRNDFQNPIFSVPYLTNRLTRWSAVY